VAGYNHPTEFADIGVYPAGGARSLASTGLSGPGRSEVMQALFGITRPVGRRLRIEQVPRSIRSPAEAVAAGIVYVPEDRGRQGAVKGLPIFQNVVLPSLVRTASAGFLRLAEDFALTRRYAERLELRAASLDQDVGLLSGGNQQKVVIAKWLATEPRVIILDEPTKGIDIGSKAAVHAFMAELASEGLAVIMVSSEIPEVLGMSDRVIVMREGKIGSWTRWRRPHDARSACDGGGGHCGARGMSGALKHREALLALAIAALVALVASRFPGFVAPGTSPRVQRHRAFDDPGDRQMIVILTKCIDLSVAATLALTGMLAALMNGAGVPLPLILGAVVVVGAAWGGERGAGLEGWASRPSW
jgi:energy-coupling factor transporter ATP-binding protein EcfA2